MTCPPARSPARAPACVHVRAPTHAPPARASPGSAAQPCAAHSGASQGACLGVCLGVCLGAARPTAGNSRPAESPAYTSCLALAATLVPRRSIHNDSRRVLLCERRAATRNNGERIQTRGTAILQDVATEEGGLQSTARDTVNRYDMPLRGGSTQESSPMCAHSDVLRRFTSGIGRASLEEVDDAAANSCT